MWIYEIVPPSFSLIASPVNSCSARSDVFEVRTECAMHIVDYSIILRFANDGIRKFCHAVVPFRDTKLW